MKTKHYNQKQRTLQHITCNRNTTWQQKSRNTKHIAVVEAKH
jgi:hypothetical protein